MTQWPNGTLPGSPGSEVPGDPGHTTPGGMGHGDLGSAFGNTTMETWPQTRIEAGCMNCHNTRVLTHDNDFVWSLLIKSYSPDRAQLASPAIIGLRELLDGF